ncbi:MAG: D-alanine--D-alanine ligase [Bacteriovoracaceae bacterium]|nr:D-alanine--D-alanine ligase [Bacteriovoracaceae bacterium]
MDSKNILLICGGGGTEHEISLTSAAFIQESLNKISSIRPYYVEISKDGSRVNDKGEQVELRKGGFLYNHQTEELITLHFAIPCFHGPPGETGEIQSVFEMMKLPYLGSGPEASMLCFNKVSTKLWLDAACIPNTPFCFIKDLEEISKASEFLDKEKEVFVKASSQGSSIGCFKVVNEAELKEAVTKALKLSPYVLIEKSIKGRELEVSVFEHNGKVVTSHPGEILCPENDFYSYEEKYSDKSHTDTVMKAEGLSSELLEEIQAISIKAFSLFKLSHLSRVDFFLSENKEIYLNEINTFPGMTPISMFPKMMESGGVSFSEFLESIIKNNVRS